MAADAWYFRLKTSDGMVYYYTIGDLAMDPAVADNKRWPRGSPVKGGVLLGRQPTNNTKTTIINSPIISRTHAQVFLGPDGHIYLIDCGSMHGSSVRAAGDSVAGWSRVPPHQPIPLNDGDEICLGKAIFAKGSEMVPPKLTVAYKNTLIRLPVEPVDLSNNKTLYTSHEDIEALRAWHKASSPSLPSHALPPRSTSWFRAPAGVDSDSEDDGIEDVPIPPGPVRPPLATSSAPSPSVLSDMDDVELLPRGPRATVDDDVEYLGSQARSRSPSGPAPAAAERGMTQLPPIKTYSRLSSRERSLPAAAATQRASAPQIRPPTTSYYATAGAPAMERGSSDAAHSAPSSLQPFLPVPLAAFSPAETSLLSTLAARKSSPPAITSPAIAAATHKVALFDLDVQSLAGSDCEEPEELPAGAAAAIDLENIAAAELASYYADADRRAAFATRLGNCDVSNTVSGMRAFKSPPPVAASAPATVAHQNNHQPLVTATDLCPSDNEASVKEGSKDQDVDLDKSRIEGDSPIGVLDGLNANDTKHGHTANIDGDADQSEAASDDHEEADRAAVVDEDEPEDDEDYEHDYDEELSYDEEEENAHSDAELEDEDADEHDASDADGSSDDQYSRESSLCSQSCCADDSMDDDAASDDSGRSMSSRSSSPSLGEDKDDQPLLSGSTADAHGATAFGLAAVATAEPALPAKTTPEPARMAVRPQEGVRVEHTVNDAEADLHRHTDTVIVAPDEPLSPVDRPQVPGLWFSYGDLDDEDDEGEKESESQGEELVEAQQKPQVVVSTELVRDTAIQVLIETDNVVAAGNAVQDTAPLNGPYTPANEPPVLADQPPALVRTRSLSPSSSADAPVTPPSMRKRGLDEFVRSQTDIDVAVSTDDAPVVAPSPLAQVSGSPRPVKKLRAIASTVGLIAIGAALGSVGTIAGLMQLAD